jgi:hypothetical protein
MVAIIIDRRALPIYWEFLDKKGCSNLAEQQQVLRPVFKRQRKYRGSQPKEAWYLVTNLDSADAAIAVYSRRMGIEMMFWDCKLGGYHLEGSKASTPRLNSLVLLIAIAYTQSCLQENKYRSTSTFKYNRWRWRIEQLFATLKLAGLDLEARQLESISAIQRLTVWLSFPNTPLVCLPW